MIKYDLLLLEPLYWNRSHGTFDIQNLVNIFTAAGLKVAVVSFLKDDPFYQNKPYDVIEICPDKKFPDFLSVLNERNIIVRFIRKINLDFVRYRYFREIFEKIKDLSDNFYFGTYTDDSFTIFLLPFQNRKIYFWGLRSYYFNKPLYAIKRNIYIALRCLIIRRRILRNTNIRFFVSNFFIYDEFNLGGIHKDRLILRPERTINQISEFNISSLNKLFTVLTVGFIRKDKNLRFSIDVLKNLDLEFVIAGKADTDDAKVYDEYLEKNNFKNITRVKGYLKEKEYNDLFMKAHFVLIADNPQLSTVSNGTILEALFKGRPLILPDRAPYNWYVNEYGVGLTFKPGDKQSLIKVLEKARELGTENFIDAIKEFQKNYLINNVVDKVMSQMEGIKNLCK